MAEPFFIAVPEDRLAAIHAKVEAFDWSIMPDAEDWRSGVGLADLKRLVDYWLTRYDWRAQERRLNLLPQFTTEVQGQRLHFIHARGDGSRPPAAAAARLAGVVPRIRGADRAARRRRS